MTSNISPIPLPVRLKPSNLRPIVYRIFSKKYGLHVKSDALEILTEYIGSNFGADWKSSGSLKFIEQAAKNWKAKYQSNKNLFVDGENLRSLLLEMKERKNDTINSSSLYSRTIAAEMTDAKLDANDLDMEDISTNSFELQAYFHIKDFFDLPIVKYNHLSKKYEPYLLPHNELRSESVTARRYASDFNMQDNVDLYLARYYQAYHRLLRNDTFKFSIPLNPFSLIYLDELNILALSNEFNKFKLINEDHSQITLIKNLLGRHGKHFIIFGLLTRNQEGKFKLQDSTDSIQLDLTNAYPNEEFFYFEGCLLFCDGMYVNFNGKSKFITNLIYHPTCESRSKFFHHFGYLNFQSIQLDLINSKLMQSYDKYQASIIENLTLNQEEEEDMGSFKDLLEKIIFLGSGIPLDTLRALDYLKKFFIEITKDLNNLPIAIVFCGSFTSRTFDVSSTPIDNSSMGYKSLFDSLAMILSDFPHLCKKTQFIFVAGHKDPWNSMVYQGSKATALPFNRLSNIFFTRLRKVVKNLKVVSNPFKIYYLNEEIMVMNDQVYERMVQNDILLNYYKRKEELVRTVSEELEDEEITSTAKDFDAINEENDDLDRTTAKLLYSKHNNLETIQKKNLKYSNKKTLKLHIKKLVNTLVHQSHLSPFATIIKPVAWKYDQLLSMNPLPTSLILIDSSIEFFNEIEAGMKFVNAGGFISSDNRSANYTVYYPSTRAAELKKIYHVGF